MKVRIVNPNTLKWLDALKSGEYKQGQKTLRDEDKFCCLGVACDLFAQAHRSDAKWIKLEPHVWQFAIDPEDDDSKVSEYLNADVKQWVGLQSISGEPSISSDSPPNLSGLAYLNDEGLTFKEIAEEIELHPEEYLTPESLSYTNE